MLRALVLRDGAEGLMPEAPDWRGVERELRPFVARRVSTSDVDDVMQEVLLRIQLGLPTLRDEDRLGGWMRTIARSAIVDHHRSSARHRVISAELDDEAAPSEDDDRAVEAALAPQIASFVVMLPSPYREALTLTELEGLTQKQAAEVLGISLTAMKSRVQRGRAQLREALEACCRIALDARKRVVSCEPRTDGRLPSGVQTRQFLPPSRCDGGCMTRTPSRAPARIAPTQASWTREEMERERASWIEPLDRAVLDDVRAIARSLADRPLDTLRGSLLPREGPLAAAAARWRADLAAGRGFVLLRGMEIDGVPEDELARRFVVLGLHLGGLVPQNLRGELLTHIRDTGADPKLLSTRLYTTRAEQDFHTDGADVIGLFCRRTAREGGVSRIVSSVRILEEIQRARPDLFEVLFEDFPWHYQEEGIPPLVLTRPIASVTRTEAEGARINTFFIPWYIRRSQELPDAPRLTAAQTEAIALVESLANDPRLCLDMQFEPGDVQWLKNAAILHKRTAYEDHDAPEHKRHLLRLWLSAPDFDDGDAQLRAGISSDLRPQGRDPA
ncbi:MAG: sigma-70 family RNA polymerase sigma factor [Sandaracinus sp.]